MRYASQLDRLTVENKGRNDFVSQVDREAEAEIIDVLKRAYPDHAILAEETGRQGKSEFLWIIDPLDGTTTICTVTRSLPCPSPASPGPRHPAVVFDPLKTSCSPLRAAPARNSTTGACA